MQEIQKNKDITELSNYKTPAKARYFFELSTRQDIDILCEILLWVESQSIPYIFISGGTNMLFAFDTYEGLIIKNSLTGWTYDIKTKLLVTYGSESIWNIAEILEKQYRQDIWHRFIGLPGSIAGAIYGNAGCFGLETESNFLEAEVLDIGDKKIKVFSKENMKFSYRNSRFKEEKKYFIISASFDLSEKREKYASTVDNIYFREHEQPKGNSCGSFFKNPSREQSAGYLIEQVGLKGHHLAGAYFSEKHANFLMHDGLGSYRDLLELIALAQRKVQEQFSVSLEPEVQIIYNQ